MKNLMGKVNSKMRENKRNGRRALKGFTLVEIIVVLVILAILAAAMIPALTGYIDKAKERTAVAEGRNVLTAAQTLTSEAYGLGRKMQQTTNPAVAGDSNYQLDDILTLADVKGGSAALSSFTLTADSKKVDTFVYVTKDGKYNVKYTSTEGLKTKAVGDADEKYK